MSYAEMCRKRHSNDEGIDSDLPLELAVGIDRTATKPLTATGRTPRCTRDNSRDAKLGLLKLFSVAISEQPAFQKAWKTS